MMKKGIILEYFLTGVFTVGFGVIMLVLATKEAPDRIRDAISGLLDEPELMDKMVGLKSRFCGILQLKN